jgi:hypothetical protein
VRAARLWADAALAVAPASAAALVNKARGPPRRPTIPGAPTACMQARASFLCARAAARRQGNVSAAEGDPAAAGRCYAAALAVRPGCAEAHFNLGCAHAHRRAARRCSRAAR